MVTNILAYLFVYLCVGLIVASCFDVIDNGIQFIAIIVLYPVLIVVIAVIGLVDFIKGIK